MGRLSITSHAVERFQERWAPELTIDEVRRELELVANDARPQKSRSLGGQELWASACLGRKILFVVKRDMGHRICVTVLPQGATEATAIGPGHGRVLGVPEGEGRGPGTRTAAPPRRTA